MTATFADFVAALAGAPALPGARCRGRSHLFDSAHPGETPEASDARQVQALGLCVRCPALTACDRWLSSLTPADRPLGVVAGRMVGTC